MIAKDELLTLMQNHIGRTQGATVDKLVKEFNLQFAPKQITDRDIRQAVLDLRMAGHHICAHPRSGYYMAENAADLHETEAFLRTRALASLQQVAAMRRVSLPELIGQQRFLLERDDEPGRHQTSG